MTPVIFDFDGVVADSEWLSNLVFAEELTAAGFPTTTEQAIERYVGLRWAECAALIEARHGGPADSEIDARWRAGMRARIEAGELAAMPGLARFLGDLGARPIAIASSSPSAMIRDSLARFGLAERFGDSIFSGAEHVERGKPHPDLYLYAAEALGARPADCFVIEDSPVGVEAGVRAGMRVCGLTAGRHCLGGHGERLLEAGARIVAGSYEEVAAALAAFEREMAR